MAHWTRRALEPRRQGDAVACADRVVAALGAPAPAPAAAKPLNTLVVASLGVLTVAGIAAGLVVRRHRGGAR